MPSKDASLQIDTRIFQTVWLFHLARPYDTILHLQPCLSLVSSLSPSPDIKTHQFVDSSAFQSSNCHTSCKSVFSQSSLSLSQSAITLRSPSHLLKKQKARNFQTASKHGAATTWTFTSLAERLARSLRFISK